MSKYKKSQPVVTYDSSSEDEECKIIPRDDQARHLKVILSILDKFGFALNNSALSSGKSYISMAVFKELKLKHIIYIGTLTMIEEIKELFEEFNVPTNHLYTFQSLRSIKNKQPKHGFLTRYDNPKTGDITFEVTHKLHKLIKEGVLLIADEIQYVRNDDSLQCIALAEIEKAIIEYKGTSKVMELSGLLGGKGEYYLNMCNRFRIIKNSKLSITHRDTGNTELLGAQELVDFCMNLNPILTTQIIDNKPFKGKNVAEVCFDLYTEIVQDHISDSMPPPKSSVNIDCKNGYYNLSSKDLTYLNRAIGNLDKASGFDSNTGNINPKNTCWSMVTKSLRHIEISKINIFISNAIKDLEANRRAKVCIGLNYNISVDLISKALSKYGVLVLCGKVQGKKRKSIMKKFNEPNTLYRVLVANIKVVNCGIKLDDRNGNYPRFVYGSSSFFFIECHQFSRRFVRGRESLSNAKLRFVYGQITSLERSILKALASHTEVCIRTSKKQVENGVKFPGEYEDEINYSEEECESYYDIGEIIKELYKNKGDNEEDSNLIADFTCKKKIAKKKEPPPEIIFSSEDEAEEVVDKRPPPSVRRSPTLTRRRLLL